MNQRTKNPSSPLPWAAVATACLAAGTFALAGCSRQDQNDARASADQAVAQIKQGAREAGKEASKGLDKAKVAAADLAKEAKVEGKAAGDSLNDKLADTVVTAGVKAELAKDTNLSALQIDVSTDAGRVALHGTAPSAQARDRATELARSVKGVSHVENDLTVDPGK